MGLGNPGRPYVGTRHNVGFEVVMALAEAADVVFETDSSGSLFGSGEIEGRSTGLLLPQTFMNASGEAVETALAHCPAVLPVSGLLVVYDDLDLPLGRIRLRPSGGAGGQRGMQSILSTLGHEDFARLRFGIGRPDPRMEVRDWVLGSFEAPDRPHVEASVERSGHAIRHWLLHGIDSAMDQYNRPSVLSGDPS